MASFSSSGDEGEHFSFWLRQLEDLLHIRPAPLNDEQNAYLLIARLSGTVREKVEELPQKKRFNYATLAEFLRAYFEGPAELHSSSEAGHVRTVPRKRLRLS